MRHGLLGNRCWTALAAATMATLALAAAPGAARGEAAKTPAAPPPPDTRLGYDDTPFLPDSPWRVHDSKRPRPPVVAPAPADRIAAPPADAVVLFDGKDLAQWQVQGKGADKGRIVPAAWKVQDGYMEIVPGAGSLFTKEKFGDCQIHIEWATPAVAKGDSQGRGNSGVLIMGRYEIQVLDSYGNETYADGQAASMYGLYPPLVNVCRKPGEWQTFDIIFEAPRFDGDKVGKPAFVTVLHNGVLVHHRRAFIGSSLHRQVGKYSPHEPEAPILLQEHGNPVRFRNIWVRRLTGLEAPAPAAK